MLIILIFTNVTKTEFNNKGNLTSSTPSYA